MHILRLNVLVLVAVGALLRGEVSLRADEPAARVQSGLVALYDFNETSGEIVHDRSGVDPPLNLRIADSSAVRHSSGSLEVRRKTVIRSEKPPARLIEAIRRSGEITIEAWIRPSSVDQTGPARIVTLSRDTGERNFTLGQDKDKYDARLRTTKATTNGMPSLSTSNGQAATALAHVVYTRARGGRAKIYANGKQRGEMSIEGDASNWSNSFELALANELSGDRPWLGSFHLVAIYSRDLAPREVEQNHQAGPQTDPAAQLAAREKRRFELEVAPLLARHCLECHDSGSKKGQLDLSRKAPALAGGESGKVIEPGKVADSLLWDFVESDEMPADRPPLSDAEKEVLKQWIEAGALWSLDVIDPAIYEHDSRAADVWVQRLTIPEYVETVKSAVGVDIRKEAYEILPPDVRADGFSNTSYNLTVDLKHVDAYAELARIIVERMDVKAFAGRFSKSRRLSTDDNQREFVAAMGKWLLRGPLSELEVTTFCGIPTTVASAGGDFEEAARYTIEAMLQSPRFIYRIESQRGDGTAWPVGPYELASRLSYILWGGPPDEELLRAADSGKLTDRSVVEAQVKRMLDDPRAIERSSQFVYQWLDLGRLQNLQPNAEKFPEWNSQLADDMRDETLGFFQEIAWKQNRPLADLLNAQVTVASPRLAELYGLKPQGKGARVYDVSSVPGRGGLLTHGSVLTVGGDEASMVSRGLFVLHDLLRGTVKDPPPCVDTTPVPTKAGLTQRGIAESRIANVKCGGCHSKFEPLAFGLEKFDGIGAYHETDKHGNKLRDDGEIQIPGGESPVKYESSAELMNVLAQSERVRECITWKVAQFALGRPLVAADAPILKNIHDTAQQNGGTYRSLITAIVLSDLVQKTRTEPYP